MTLDRFKAIRHKFSAVACTLQYEVLVVVQAKLRGNEYSGTSKVSAWGNSEQAMDQVRIAKHVRHIGDASDGEHASPD